MHPLPEGFHTAALSYEHHLQVAALHRLGWQQAYAPIFGAEALQALSLPHFEQLWQERLSPSDRHYLGLWQGGQLQGFAGFGAAEGRPGLGEIYHFYFHPDCWGRGVAGPVMHQQLLALKAQGYQGVVLWVLQANERARRFYSKWGFVPNGRQQQRQRYGLLLEEVQLERALDGAQGEYRELSQNSTA